MSNLEYEHNDDDTSAETEIDLSASESLRTLSPQQYKELLIQLQPTLKLVARARLELITDINATFAKIAPQLGVATRQLEINRSKFPQNWQDADALLDQTDDFEAAVMKTVVDDAIPTGWVTTQELLHQLILAPNKEQRESILMANKNIIENECDTVLRSVTGAIWGTRKHEVINLAGLAEKSLSAHRSGHTEASQALSTVVIDTLLGDFHLTKLHPHSKDFTGRVSVRATNFTSCIVFAPLYLAHTSFDAKRDDLKSFPYNRHVSVHAASIVQYTPLNALIALMNMTSLMIFTEKYGRVNESLILTRKQKA